MSLPLIRKLGRDWHVKAGFADVHPLTQIHNRPVGATTSWLRVREHKAAVTLANSLIHTMGNFMEKSPFETRDGLRMVHLEIQDGVTNIVECQHRQGNFCLAAELFFYNDAYVVTARDGAMIAEWEAYAEWIGRARRGTLTGDQRHVRLYLQTF